VIGYYLGITLLPVFIGVGLFLGLQLLVVKYHLSDQDAKGYFILAMLFATLTSVGVAYFGGKNFNTQGVEIVSSPIGILVTVGVSIVILITGLLNVRKIYK